jgi:hypothetical protein
MRCTPESRRSSTSCSATLVAIRFSFPWVAALYWVGQLSEPVVTIYAGSRAPWWSRLPYAATTGRLPERSPADAALRATGSGPAYSIQGWLSGPCLRLSSSHIRLAFRISSDLRGARANPLPVDLHHRAQIVFRVLPHPLVVDLGDHRGYGQRILEVPSQLQGVVEVL